MMKCPMCGSQMYLYRQAWVVCLACGVFGEAREEVPAGPPPTPDSRPEQTPSLHRVAMRQPDECSPKADLHLVGAGGGSRSTVGRSCLA